MKIIIFGLGSIGERHARLLLNNYDHEIYAFRSSKKSKPNKIGIAELFSWQEVEKVAPQVAIISNPTSLHIKTALRCAGLGMHLFIEKPLSHDLDGVARLKALCRRKGLTCYVGYCLRFHPVIKKLKELLNGNKIYQARVVCSSYLPDWRPGKDPKSTYSARRGLGGGVLLDLSHEFDYVSYLFGGIKEMQGVFGKLAKVTRDAEDFADVLITAGNNVRVNLHIDYFSRLNERSIKIDCEGGYILGDLIGGGVERSINGDREVFKFEVDRNAYLREQMAYFLMNLGKKKMMNDLNEAIPLLGSIVELKHE